MLFLAYLLQGAGFGLAAAAQPGPFMAYLVSQTLAHGWRRTLPAALAPLISDGPIIVAMLLVLTRLPDSWRVVLYLAGGTFILYLARGAYRNWRQYAVEGGEDRGSPASGGISPLGQRGALPHAQRAPSSQSAPQPGRDTRSIPAARDAGMKGAATARPERDAPRSVLHAALINMLGPGPYLFWSLVTGPVLIQGWRAGPPNALAFLAGFYGVMVSCLAGMIVVTGTAAHLGPKVTRALLGASAVALAVFGCIQLWRGLALLGVWDRMPI